MFGGCSVVTGLTPLSLASGLFLGRGSVNRTGRGFGTRWRLESRDGSWTRVRGTVDAYGSFVLGQGRTNLGPEGDDGTGPPDSLLRVLGEES